MKNWHKKSKVIAYITRNHGEELLVFDHRDFEAAGTQVPAGTVESGEDLKLAILREIKEESGLIIAQDQLVPLGQFEWRRFDRKEIHQRHVFWINLEASPLERWTHVVQGNGEDQDLVFNYYWIKIDDVMNGKNKISGRSRTLPTKNKKALIMRATNAITI